ncbi:MAG: hypothetical protein V7749_01200 [Cocleimonas sp.]
MKIIQFCILSIALLHVSSVFADDGYTHVGRYYKQKILITAAQRDPLLQKVEVIFPFSVQNIESAYRHLLAPTGYTLAKFEAIDKNFITLASKKLPLSQREVKGRVIDLLNLLAGSDFIVVRDDLLRVVAIDLNVVRY